MHPSGRFSPTHEDEGDSSYTPPLNPAAEALLSRSTALLEEVEAFQRELRRSRLEKTVELRLYLNQVKSEHRCLQALAFESPASTKSRHGVHASNLPYLEAIWGQAKTTTGIVGLCKTFRYTEPGKKKKANVTVDIVAQNGLQWIKVSLLTPRRLLFELAKAGWEEDEDSDGSASLDPGPGPSPEPSTSTTALATASTSLSNIADNLLLAARQTRVQYLHPIITFILPKLPPTTPEVTAFLSTLQQKGITVSTPTSLLPAPSVEDVLSALASPLARRPIPLTDPINLDTTILLALISDISHHASVTSEQRFHPAIVRQLEMEKSAPMLPSYLLPVLENRTLITCASSLARFAEIVSIIASDSESERARLLIDNAAVDDPPLTPADRSARMVQLSVYDCSALRLPVLTVPDHTSASTDPPAFLQVSEKLSTVNRAAFMTGWSRELTTVTSNRAVAKLVEAACYGSSGGGEEEGEVVGPDVFIIESARSLVGKVKGISDVVRP